MIISILKLYTNLWKKTELIKEFLKCSNEMTRTKKNKNMNHRKISDEVSYSEKSIIPISYDLNDMEWYEIFTHMFIVSHNHIISFVWNVITFIHHNT